MLAVEPLQTISGYPLTMNSGYPLQTMNSGYPLGSGSYISYIEI